MIRASETPIERKTEREIEITLTRTFAGAERRLRGDLNLSQLQAIDRLQKLSEQFHEQWFSLSPWLVLKDCWTLPVSMPVPKMLEAIAKHGDPVGIVGMAELKALKHDAIFRMFFRKDKKSRETVEASAEEARKQLEARRQAVFLALVYLNESGDEVSVRFQQRGQPEQTPEPGFKLVGCLAYTVDERVKRYSPNEDFTDVMEQAEERFSQAVKQMRQIQAEAAQGRSN
jgi:hypothetical protein